MKGAAEPAIAVPSGKSELAGGRWMILAFLMALCFISHFNRASITSAGDERIMTQFAISTQDMGIIYSAFRRSGWASFTPRSSLSIRCS